MFPALARRSIVAARLGGINMMSTILVIEDDASSRHLIARLLRREGYETLSACNGEQALQMLSFMQPALILLDLMMPVMDGLEFLKILRKNYQWANVPVIVWTATLSESTSIRQARHLGVKDCFIKSAFTLDQLYTSIRRHAA
jgi:CheY-like chemotaxis protein